MLAVVLLTRLIRFEQQLVTVLFGHTFKIRLCALNDDSSEESDPEPTQESVKQAKVGLDTFNQINLHNTKSRNCRIFLCRWLFEHFLLMTVN